jgi:Putative beta barrel porin-7 (BBP7)
LKQNIFSPLCILLISANLCFADEPAETFDVLTLPIAPAAEKTLPADVPLTGAADPNLVGAPAPAESPSCPQVDCGIPCTEYGPRIWGSSDYLLWWVKSAPLPVPVVTTGDPAQGFLAGAIGRPGTQVLLGNHDVGFGAFSGGRVTLGGWFDRDQLFGIEGSGFLLQQKTATFLANSSPNGLPVLAVPFSNQFPTFGFVGVGPVGENVFQAASSAIPSTGSILVTNSIRLWGAEANGVLCLLRGDTFRLEALIGFRYLDLEEDFDLALSTTTTSHASIGPFPPTGQIFDHFGTRNQFYGGQLGLRGGFSAGRWSFEGSAKVALGDNHQSVNINGDLIDSGRGFWFFRDNSGNFPGGIFAQTSNSGRRTREQFAVIPEFQAKIGYDLTSHVRLTAGYDFLYLNNVVRPGNQIDRVVNPSQNYGGPLVGPANPAPQFNNSTFWAQGMTFGLEFRF